MHGRRAPGHAHPPAGRSARAVSTPFDFVVIGGGPAGLAAAVQARQLGLTVTLIDEQPEPGGQIYRAVERAEAEGRAAALGEEYRHGLALARAFRDCGATYLASHQAWQVERDGRVFATDGTASRLIEGHRVLVAVGAIERPVPIPGWTLPGVMTVGAAQILHKSIGLLPDAGVWIAGSGPLTLHFAAEIVAAGGRVAGILDTARASIPGTALAHLGGVLRGWRYLAKGLGYLAQLRMADIRRVTGVEAVEAAGDSRLERVRWRVGSQWNEAPASGLLLHEGVIPNTQVTLALGCAHDWDPVQQCFRPRADAFGATDVEAIIVAGDCGGIGGARVAECRGRLAALGAAAALGRITPEDRDRRAEPVRRELEGHDAIRGFLDALYSPAPELLAPSDDVVACRCEGVTAGRIREAVSLGCLGPNQVKSFTRCGMGPCQGRMCGPTVTGVIAAALGVLPQEVGTFRIRPPLKPLRLGELAALADEERAA
ncbi:MAG: FAD-dependent oxidoreductase [Betaproteobacteria bacterium]|nr:FAD-dependent oxidoreductase [Betaproteobacteria bacterium]